MTHQEQLGDILDTLPEPVLFEMTVAVHHDSFFTGWRDQNPGATQTELQDASDKILRQVIFVLTPHFRFLNPSLRAQ